MWDRIEIDLESGDAPSAAQKLRRGSEYFFSEACDMLHAPVRYKMNGRWELGDFLPSSVSALKNLLKHGKSASQSWKQDDEKERITEIENQLTEIYDRTLAHQWGINTSVHYSHWHDLTVEEIRPIIEAFHDLYSVFQCQDCETSLRIVTEGVNKSAVKCSCGNYKWNLSKKPKG